MKNEILEFANVRHFFEDSINFSFDYFKFNLENLFYSKLDIRTEWENLLYQHLNKKISAKKAIDKLDKWFLELVITEKIDDWVSVGALLGRNTLADLFFKIHTIVDDKTYWMLLGNCYTNSYLGFEEKFIQKTLFLSKRSHREFMMDEDERKCLDLLPSELTIYRGCSLAEIESEKFRYSWTLNKDIANFFANEYRRNKHIKCGVVEKVVNKERLLAYFNGREEDEVIYIS
jgi:hypothetical protein